MNCKCKLYGSTWFNKINLPSSPQVLWDNYDPILETDVKITQQIDLTYIRVEAYFNEIKDVDYVEIAQPNSPIGAVFYTVEKIDMLSEKVAQLTLLLDPLNTCGGLNYGNDNLCKVNPVYMIANRMHIADDDYGKYNLPEEFIPASPLEIEISNQIGDTGSSWGQVVNFTMVADPNPTKSKNLPAETQTENKEVLLIPITQGVNDTKYNVNGRHVSGTVGALFISGEASNKVVNVLRQYGIEQSIISSYVLPFEYVQLNLSTTIFGMPFVGTANGLLKTYGVSGITLIKECANKKALIGEFNKIILASNCSGEKVEVLPEDVSDNGTLNISIISDARYDGKPTAFFTNYKKNTNNNFIMQAVNGLNWANAPLMFVEKSGGAVDRLNLQSNIDITQKKALGQTIGQTIMGVAGLGLGIASIVASGGISTPAVMGMLGASANILGAFNTQASYNEERERELAQFNRSQYYVAPEVNFARSSTVRDYKGNGFFVIKYKLSDIDLYNYDLYLTMFGYNVGSKQITSPNELYNRQLFNYIRVNDVHFSSFQIPMYILKQLETLLKTGVRLWHQHPTAINPLSNPLI